MDAVNSFPVMPEPDSSLTQSVSLSIDDVYGRYVRRIHDSICSRLYNEDDRKDIESIFWLRVMKYLPSFNYRSDPELIGWLFTILENIINDFWRRESRVQIISLSQEIYNESGDGLQLEDMIPADVDIEDTTLHGVYIKHIFRHLPDAIKDVEEDLFDEPDQLQLLRHKIRGEALPEDRDANWMRVYWLRIRRKIISKLALRIDKQKWKLQQGS